MFGIKIVNITKTVEFLNMYVVSLLPHNVVIYCRLLKQFNFNQMSFKMELNKNQELDATTRRYKRGISKN